MSVQLFLGVVVKKYLISLGAVLIGSGLTFVLMHGETDAQTAELESFVCSEFIGGISYQIIPRKASTLNKAHHRLWDCRTQTIRCVVTEDINISCTKD